MSRRGGDIPQNRRVGKVKNDRTIRESDQQWTHFEKVTGQCQVGYVLRTHEGVVCRVDAGALLLFVEAKNLNRGTCDVTQLSTQVSQSDTTESSITGFRNPVILDQ